jgi:hypothetical protein
MADPNFEVEYRLGDEDNTILKKLLKNIRSVISGTATISTNSAPTAGTPTSIKVDSADATALAANTARRRWTLQNVGTNPLVVSFGGASLALAPGTSNDDGRGGSFSDDLWRGAVTVTGTGLRYNVFEMV